MPILKVTLEYDGTHYHGWQIQPNLTTIQGELEKALLRLTGKTIRTYGAGRTDAGVHAVGQVAHFSSPASFQPEGWVRGLNALLPNDIAVSAVEEVDAAFHARFSAKNKIYSYFIYNGRKRSPLRRHRMWHIHPPLDTRKMKAAAKNLIGEHDFTSFCAAQAESDNRRIDLKKIAIKRANDEIRITMEASRFLQHMVRNIVGFLVEVGRKRRSVDEIEEILKAKDRRKAGPTAPPHGLVLERIEYE